MLIEDSADLRSKARRLKTQVNSVTRLIAPDDVGRITAELQTQFSDCGDDLDQLLACLFDVSSETVVEHHRIFYSIGPYIELYPFEVGKTMTLKSFTKSGFPKASNIKVWGTYYFKGLENSMLSGAANWSIETFVNSTAYVPGSTGLGTDKPSGSIDVKRDNIESLLFGSGENTTSTIKTDNGPKEEENWRTRRSIHST